MKIAVLGTINKDLILPFQNAPIESFGGIFYDVYVLSQLLDKNDQIIPVSFIGEDIETTVRAILNKMPNVSPDGLISLPEKNHKVILEYTTPQERQEKSLFQFPSLAWQHIEKIADADIIILNMISGWDLEMDAFLKLSELARERLYIDIHYLVMGLDKLGRRFYRTPDRVSEWLKGAHFIQMNQEEYTLLANETEDELGFFHQNCKKDQVLLVTKASNGATMIASSKNKNIEKKQYPAFKVPRLIDTTGCGDAFGAGFIVKYLQTRDVDRAVKFANLVAAANAALKGTNEMHRLLEMMNVLNSANNMLVKI